MTANLRLVANSAEGHAHELAIGGTRDGLPQRGLADARGPHQAEDGPLELAHPLLYRQVFKDTFLNLLQAIVILFQYLRGQGQVIANAGAFLPGDVDEGVDVVTHHRRLGGHGCHELEFAQFAQGLVLGLLGHSGLLDAFGQFIDLTRWCLIQVAQFLLDGLHLLVEVVLALVLLHLLFDAATDTLLRLEDVVFPLHQPHQMLDTFLGIENLQHMLLLIQPQGHMRGQGVRQARGVIDASQRGQDLGRYLLVELDVLVEEAHGRSHQHLHLALVHGDRLGQGGHGGDKEMVGVNKPVDARPASALHQNLHGAIGQLEELQDVGEGPNLMEIQGIRFVGVRALLGNEQDLLVAGHGAIEGPDRLVTADEEGNHHVGVDDDVP